MRVCVKTTPQTPIDFPTFLGGASPRTVHWVEEDYREQSMSEMKAPLSSCRCRRNLGVAVSALLSPVRARQLSHRFKKSQAPIEYDQKSSDD
jgi:hypothetical protein